MFEHVTWGWVASMEVDKVVGMEVDKVADMEMDKVLTMWPTG